MPNLISIIMLNAAARTATVLLSAPLGGGETFQGSRLPGFTTGPGLGVAPVALASSGPTTVGPNTSYVITFPTQYDNIASEGLWYVRTVIAGVGAAGPLPVWMDPSLFGFYCLCGRTLRDIIMSQKPGIDLWLQAVDPVLQFQASVFGTEWNESAATPGVLVKPYSAMLAYEEMPRGRLNKLSYHVTCIIRSSDASNEAEAISQFTESLDRILNQACYETIQLSDGTILNGGQSEDYNFSDDVIDGTWASKASFIWSWECIRYTG